MAATIRDLSRRGDEPNALGVLSAMAALVDTELATWISAANSQNLGQLLSLLTNSAGAPGFLGWTIKARLAALSGGSPVELMSQWVLNTTTAAVTAQVGLAAGHAPAGGLGNHGLLSGGRGTTNTAGTVTLPMPIGAATAWSLKPGQEFFAFSFSQHSFTNRQALALLIAKDVTTGDWHLSNTDMAAVINTVAWSRNLPQLLLSGSFRQEWFSSGPPFVLSRPAQWIPITPGVGYVVPLPPVQWWDPVVLPEDLAIYNRTFSNLGYFKAADGSEWLQLGPARLAVRVVNPT
ncbi:hypothetical protein [Cyanobium sp. Morenito 9A2]|uniref:hypothetical protein n=1 Tax=Cyanobium sp. Morenito 9A2 TaxID=2823718 RepID=UPI0020CDBA55|nr:hypothetical protein [Cyanobium sp. Morenito 9A2]MCP9849222.1 hypothetical protein [Cyanobium sp. Morenito 9A2]